MNKFYENKPFTNKVKSGFTHKEMNFLTLCQKMANMITPIVTGYGVAGQQPNYGYWVWKSGCLV